MLYGIVVLGLTGVIVLVYAEYVKMERRYERLSKSADQNRIKFNADRDTLSRAIDAAKSAHEKDRAELVGLVNIARQDAAAWQTESLKLRADRDALETTVNELKLLNISLEKRNTAVYEHSTTAIQLLTELVEQTGIQQPQLGSPWYIPDEESPDVIPFVPHGEDEPL